MHIPLNHYPLYKKSWYTYRNEISGKIYFLELAKTRAHVFETKRIKPKIDIVEKPEIEYKILIYWECRV